MYHINPTNSAKDESKHLPTNYLKICIKKKYYFKICLLKTIKNIKIKHLIWAFRLICLFGVFFLKKCYVYSIFTTNSKWKFVIGSNLHTTEIYFLSINNSL